MSTPPTTDRRSRPGPILGVVAAACVACCIGPILAVLGAIAALGVASTILIGALGLFVAALAIGAFVMARRRRQHGGCTLPADPVPVELSRQ